MRYGYFDDAAREYVIDRVDGIPAAWDGFTVRRFWRGAVYDISVSNPDHVEKGVKAIRVDGEDTSVIPVFTEGEHKVEVLMG